MRTANGHSHIWKYLSSVFLSTSLLVRGVLASPQSNPVIKVQMYNLASVDPQVLTDAENRATRIFRATGIDVLWFNCPLSESEAKANPICIAPCPRSRFAVRISSEMPAKLATGTLGVALHETEIYVTIYYPNIEEMSRVGIAPPAQILGHAVVHELGHLLLGPIPHASVGIMRGGWTKEDLHAMTRGALLFTPRQTAVIRQAALLRTEAEASVGYSAVRRRRPDQPPECPSVDSACKRSGRRRGQN